MARNRAPSTQEAQQPAGPLSAQRPAPEEARATPEGHGGDPSGQEGWQRTRESGTGKVFFRCPKCAAQNTEEQLAKNKGECRQCDEVMPKAEFVDVVAEKSPQVPVVTKPETLESKVVAAGKMPGAEPKPDKPSCPKCGARMTETAVGLVCPDASTSPKHRVEEQPKPVVDAAWEKRVAEAKKHSEEREKTRLPQEVQRKLDASPLAQQADFDQAVDDVVNAQGFLRFTVGEITISPVDYHPFKVGPFETLVMRGEGFEERLRKARLHLHELQQSEFDEQLAAYKRFMERVYPGKGRR